MQALIDGDLIAYRCAASCQSKGEVVHDFGIACARADNLIKNIEDAVGAEGNRQIFLSGGENFRKKIYPDYKANRTDQERPVYLEPLREWLVTEWGAKVTDGIEADDAMGIAQDKLDGRTIICSLDKDMLQVPGYHYQWEIQGTGSTGKKWIKEASTKFIYEQDGMFNFYWQLVMGDRADNVPGYDGKMRAVVPKFLNSAYEDMAGVDTEHDLFQYVLNLYQDDYETMIRNGRCLWIQREENDDWLNRVTPLMEELGLKLDSIPSLPQLLGQGQDVGNQNTVV